MSSINTYPFQLKADLGKLIVIGAHLAFRAWSLVPLALCLASLVGKVKILALDLMGEACATISEYL
jgi:hypothetical protein